MSRTDVAAGHPHRILIVTPFFPPEAGAPRARLSTLAVAWAAGGGAVTALTGMPNYPTGELPPEYRRREKRDGYHLVCAWLYATSNEGTARKAICHLSSMVSSVLLGARASGRADTSTPIPEAAARYEIIWRVSVLRAPGDAGETPAVDYFSPSIRMGLRNAIALESAALLRSAHVDACLSPGRAANLLKHIAGPRAVNRVVDGIPLSRIHRHPQITIASRIRRRLVLAGRDTTPMDRVLIHIYSAVARQCRSEVVVGTQSSCLELFEGRSYRIMDQVSAPLRYERAIADEELSHFPEWAPDRATTVRSWDHRMEAEWQAADLIWVPSNHLIQISSKYGADPLKFRVIPYPIDRPELSGTIRDPGARRILRVVFAGTLMLGKGVQYIYQALHKRPDLPVRMDFFGPIGIAPEGLRRLSEVGTVHGPVSRSELLEEFRNADVLLFPSLSEGSALVTLEATALGLPVVATEESGAPKSAMLIPARSSEAIIAAIETLADDPAQIERLSAAGLEETAKRSITMYSNGVVDSVKALTCRGRI